MKSLMLVILTALAFNLSSQSYHLVSSKTFLKRNYESDYSQVHETNVDVLVNVSTESIRIKRKGEAQKVLDFISYEKDEEGADVYWGRASDDTMVMFIYLNKVFYTIFKDKEENMYHIESKVDYIRL